VTRRIVSWYSHGAASTIATKLALAEFGHDAVTIACIDTGSENDDNERYRTDCERWFDHPVVMLRSEKYADVDDVIERERYLNGPTGARCTIELKKKVRLAFQRPDDLHVWGYHAGKNDEARAIRQRLSEPELFDMRCPLIERGTTKDEVLHMVERAGIRLPQMYELGYVNNNCIGCVKGGMGYWNKVRVDFPAVFARRAEQERDIGHSCIHDDDGPVFLDELDPERGNYALERSDGCSLDCHAVEGDFAAGRATEGQP
jgi:hypothetical protein